MVNILIVEDDINITRTIEATISVMGYETRTCGNGREAVELIKGRCYDLVLLDVMLPGLDGFQVIEEIKGVQVPIIFLTARQDVLDKVKGLRLGAEDYITKPFEAMELMARIDVVLRRMNKGKTQIEYKDIYLDTTKHIVTKGGVAVLLTPKEFDVLELFMQNIDVAITRERLLSAVWGYQYEGESRTVDIHIQQVRKKMGLSNDLITIPKIGYRLDS